MMRDEPITETCEACNGTGMDAASYRRAKHPDQIESCGQCNGERERQVVAQEYCNKCDRYGETATDFAADPEHYRCNECYKKWCEDGPTDAELEAYNNFGRIR